MKARSKAYRSSIPARLEPSIERIERDLADDHRDFRLVAAAILARPVTKGRTVFSAPDLYSILWKGGVRLIAKPQNIPASLTHLAGSYGEGALKLTGRKVVFDGREFDQYVMVNVERIVAIATCNGSYAATPAQRLQEARVDLEGYLDALQAGPIVEQLRQDRIAAERDRLAALDARQREALENGELFADLF